MECILKLLKLKLIRINRSFKKRIKTVLVNFLPKQFNSLNNKRLIKKWENNGCPLPPPHCVKQQVIKEYQQKLGYEVLVETGTYLGDMINAQLGNFNRIISIEISDRLFINAKDRFKNNDNVTILKGDSGLVMPDIIQSLDKPAIFWLDGHYSGGITSKGEKDCPIFEEIDAILTNNGFNHLLLIDDARCFNGVGDYPTIKELKAFVISKNYSYKIDVKHDIIRCYTE